MIPRHNLLFSIFVFIVVLTISNNLCAQRRGTLETVLAGHESNIAQVYSLDAKFEDRPSKGQRVHARWLKVGPIEKYTQDVQFLIEGNSANFYSEIYVDREKNVESRLEYPDKENAKKLNPANAYGCYGIRAPLGRYQITAHAWFRLMLRFHLYGRDDVLSLRELVTESESVACEKKENGLFEIIGDRMVTVDDVNCKYRLVVDSRNGFLVTTTEIEFNENVFKGEVLEIEEAGSCYFPRTAKWSYFRKGEVSRTVESKITSLEINGDIERNDVAIQFPEHLYVKVFDKEVISSAGVFNSKPVVLLMGKDNQVARRFEPDQMQELMEFRKNYADENLGRNERKADETTAVVRKSLALSPGRPWTVGRVVANVLLFVCAVSIAWMLYQFIRLFRVPQELESAEQTARW